MYNRYIRTDGGAYTRIPQEEPKVSPVLPEESMPQQDESAACREERHPGERDSDTITGFLRRVLDQFHLNHVDTGDLLLLVLLFLLFREDADEELLVALGLLLIL